MLISMAVVWPWWYGGAQWQSQWWLVLGGLTIAALTWLSACLSPRRTGACIPLTFVMVAFTVWTALQLVPLPQFMASSLSGAQRFVRTITTNVPVQSERTWLQPEAYRTVSISPYQTKASLAVLAVAVVMVWSSSVLILQKRWVIALACALMFSGVLNGVLGLYQAVNWSHWTLLELPRSGTTFATFVSRNSAPTYYASATAAALTMMGVIFTKQKRNRRKNYRVTYPGASLIGRIRNRLEDVFIDLNTPAIACLLIIAFLLVVTLATFSRGGILACVSSCAVTLCLTLGSRGGGFFSAAVLAGSMLVVVCGVLSFLELDQTVYSRIDEINSAIQTGNDPRWTVWGYTVRGLLTYGLAGSGLGTFRFAIQPFHDHGPNVWFHHVECVPLEVFFETGLPGLILAGCAAFMVLRQLLVHCHLQKENLLLPGVVFATCAVGVQSLVDFGIFLPGVFVPYCALLGSCLGRTRRIENEVERLNELGVAEYDQRTISKLPPRAPSPGKVIGHSVVAVTALSCMLIGLPSLAGYSVAGSLQHALSRLESNPQNDAEKEAQLLRYVEAMPDLQKLADKANEQYGYHPEVSLLIGQVEQHAWRIDATSKIDWGQTLPAVRRWELANPQLLSLILRMQDDALKPIKERIRAHQWGMALSQDSVQRMNWALSTCPQDARAAWGLLVADTELLSKSEHVALLDLLAKVIGNNTQVMVEVAIIAIREGEVDRGVAIFKRALEVDWARMNQNNLGAIARSVTAAQLISMLPANVAKQANVVDWLDRLASAPVDPIPEAAQLADQLAQHTYDLLAKSQNAQGLSEAIQVSDSDQYRALAAVAKRNHDLPLQIKMLQYTVEFNPNDIASRMQLVQALNSAGNDGTKELWEALKRNPDPNYLAAFIPQELELQARLIQELEKLREQQQLAIASSFKSRVEQQLLQALRTVRPTDAQQSLLYIDLANQLGDDEATVRQLVARAELLRNLGRTGDAIKVLEKLIAENPPQAVLEECQLRLKNWSAP